VSASGGATALEAPRKTSTDPTVAARWRGFRGPLAVAALVLLAAVIVAVVGSGSRAGTLDPRAVDQAGSKAVAQLLREQGVRVDLVQTTQAAATAAAEGTTLLVAIPDLLVESQLRLLEDTGADLVLVSPGTTALDILAPEIEATGSGSDTSRSPVCAWAPAVRAGDADLGGGVDYTVRPEAGTTAYLCYPEADAAGLARVERADGSRVTVLGSGRPLTNDRLARRGNAALALAALGEQPRLVWYLPSLADVPAGERQSLWSLLPAGIRYGVAQLVVAVLVAALWRARRLGPVVREPLPVVVRAAESVEGRARLYRRAGARDSAATALRRSTVDRLRTALGLPRGADPAAVVTAAAARTGRPPAQVGGLLYGAAPADDRSLVQLADALDDLEREVRAP
jgi:hypothetical protein